MFVAFVVSAVSLEDALSWVDTVVEPLLPDLAAVVTVLSCCEAEVDDFDCWASPELTDVVALSVPDAGCAFAALAPESFEELLAPESLEELWVALTVWSY